MSESTKFVALSKKKQATVVLVIDRFETDRRQDKGQQKMSLLNITMTSRRVVVSSPWFEIVTQVLFYKLTYLMVQAVVCPPSNLPLQGQLQKNQKQTLDPCNTFNSWHELAYYF